MHACLLLCETAVSAHVHPLPRPPPQPHRAACACRRRRHTSRAVAVCCTGAAGLLYSGCSMNFCRSSSMCSSPKASRRLLCRGGQPGHQGLANTSRCKAHAGWAAVHLELPTQPATACEACGKTSCTCHPPVPRPRSGHAIPKRLHTGPLHLMADPLILQCKPQPAHMNRTAIQVHQVVSCSCVSPNPFICVPLFLQMRAKGKATHNPTCSSCAPSASASPGMPCSQYV